MRSRYTIVAHPIQGSLDITGMIYGSLTTLRGHHRVQLAELTCFISLLVLLSVVSSLGFAKSSSDNKNENNNCPLWLPPSYTGTNKMPEYGLYAGQAYQENETLPSQYSELAIPLIDFVERFHRDTGLPDLVIEFVENYMWTSEYAGTGWEGNLWPFLALTS
jgi:hypothetical protein